MLEHLPANALPRLLRRTTFSALAAGLVGFIVAIFLAPPLGALGVALGVALAIVNLRFVDRQAAKVELSGATNARAIRRQLGTKTSLRLALVTAVIIALLFVYAPLAIGIVAGLVIYQIVFVLNTARVIATSGGLE